MFRNVVILLLLVGIALFAAKKWLNSSGSGPGTDRPSDDAKDPDSPGGEAITATEEQRRRQEAVRVITASATTEATEMIRGYTAQYPKSQMMRNALMPLVDKVGPAVSRTITGLPVSDLNKGNYQHIAERVRQEFEMEIQEAAVQFGLDVKQAKEVLFATMNEQATTSFTAIQNERGMASALQVQSYLANQVNAYISGHIADYAKQNTDAMLAQSDTLVDAARNDVDQFVWSMYKRNETIIKDIEVPDVFVAAHIATVADRHGELILASM